MKVDAMVEMHYHNLSLALCKNEAFVAKHSNLKISFGEYVAQTVKEIMNGLYTIESGKVHDSSRDVEGTKKDIL